jgi:uncharacterized protein YecT (DUF1311 family)
MKIILPFVVAAGMLAVLPAQADDIYDKCIKDSDGTNTAWGACGGDWMARADKALNDAWKKLHSSISDDATAKALLDEQRAWNGYKEKSCLFYASGYFGREGEVLSYPACQAAVIEARTTDLNAYFANTQPQ